MPPKKSLPKPAASSSLAPGKPAPARGTLQNLWANAPRPKPKPVPAPAIKIPMQFMTLEERDAADGAEADPQSSLRGGDMGLDGAGDAKEDGLMRNAREVMRNRDGTPRSASVSPVKKKPSTFGEGMKELAATKEKENKQSNMKNLVARSGELTADEGQGSGRRSPRKHGTPVPEAKLGRGGASKLAAPEGTPVPALPSSRKAGRSKTTRQTIEADYDNDEASSQTGRRSPRKHAGTPVPGSRAGMLRSGTPVENAKDSSQKMKRAGSNLTKDSSKSRRTISPRKVCSSTELSTPERNVRLPDQDKMPVVEIPAFNPDANFHKALISPAKKAMKPPGNANSRSGTPSRQPQSPSIVANIAAAFQTPTNAGSRSTTPSRQSPSNATNTASAFKVKPAAQNVSPLKKVGKHARSLSATVESPGRGKRSRTGTPRTTPPKIGVEDDDSFLSELGATPSPVKKCSPLKEAAPSNNTTPSKKDKSSSFLSPLEDTPSPPPALQPKPPVVNGLSSTNGRSSQSHRTVVEDTDAESSEDSDDDLPMAFHNPRAVASIPRIPPPVKPATTNRKGVLSTPGKDRKYKFSLKNLVASMEDNERTNETAAKVTKMMAEKDALLKNPSKNASGTATPHDRHAKLLEDVVKKSAEAGGDDAQKVLKALKRANVTQGVEMVYHFFETGEPKTLKHKKEYPKYLLDLLDKEGPNKLWHEMFGNRESREMGLRDGLFAEMVAVDKGMGEGMFYWVLDQLAKERNATLRNGYLAMLLNAPVSILGHFTPDTVRTHFKALGARKEALAMNKEMVLELEPVQESPYLGFTRGDHWGGLIDFLELLGRVAILLSDKTRKYALSLILRLCADKVVRAHISIQEAVQRTLMLLSEAFETEEQWRIVASNPKPPPSFTHANLSLVHSSLAAAV